MGINPLTATLPQLQAALNRITPNQSANSIATAIIAQQGEWRTQVENARRFNLTPENLQRLAGQSAWYQLLSARSGLQDIMGSVTESFKALLPALETITKQMKNIAAFVDPQIGNPFAGIGILGGGLIAAFITFRRAIAAMGTLTRTLVGGGLGFMLGGPVGALTGAMMVRGMGGAAAAGAAGAAAARTWGSRFMGILRVILRGIPGVILLTLGVEVLTRVIDSWEGFKTRMLAVFAELQAAMPTWLFGGGQGFTGLGNRPAIKQTERDLTGYFWTRSAGSRRCAAPSWANG